MKRITYLIFLLFISCERGEIPIAPHQAGNVLTLQIPMFPDYRNQVFVDLETRKVVKISEKTEWDLAFECAPEGKLIFLNTSKAMFAARIQAEFSQKTDTSGLSWHWETAEGVPDSTAFFQWTNKDLFILDLGFDPAGNHLGFGKIKILEVTPESWTFQYGKLQDTLPQQITLQKNPDYNSVYFSLSNEGQQVFIEPPKEDWDLLFTHYLHIFYDFDNMPYLVAGVLLNPYRTQAARAFDKTFSEIDFNSLKEYSFSSQRNLIGYDWKDYDFDQNKYVVFPEKNYLVKTREGYVYKLHFIGFYNERGEKGFPTMEFARL